MSKSQPKSTRPRPRGAPAQRLAQAIQLWLYEETANTRRREVEVFAIQLKHLRKHYDGGASRKLPAVVEPYRPVGGAGGGQWALEWETRRPAFEGYQATTYILARRLPVAEPVDWRPDHMLPEDHYAGGA